MKQCPDCKRIYSDDTQTFCLDDGTILLASSKSKVSPLNLKTTDPLFKFNDIDGTIKNRPQYQRDSLYLGLGMCLCAAVAMVLLNEPNTKQLLRDNAGHGYDAIIVLLIIIFIMGMVTSYVNVKQALDIRKLKEERS